MSPKPNPWILGIISETHKERDCKLSLILLGMEKSYVTTFKYLGVVFGYMTWKERLRTVLVFS